MRMYTELVPRNDENHATQIKFKTINRCLVSPRISLVEKFWNIIHSKSAAVDE